MQDERDTPGAGPKIGRRDLMKLGAGVLATGLGAKDAFAQRQRERLPVPPPGSPRPADELRPHTGPGYHNDYNRLDENGPMDDATRKIVEFATKYNASDMSAQTLTMVNRTMVDSMACVFAGFEEGAIRHCARLAKQVQGVELKSTVLGYGISTSPELAAFVNSGMVRLVDFNDTPHDSNLIPAALAIGEALHSTGSEVLAAVVVGYEVMRTNSGESVAPAVAAAKLMKLDEDRMANAVSLALTPHVALNKGVGALSMWKGLRSAEAIKCGVWAALMAREGITGPPQPFEGRGGLWSRTGAQNWKLPAEPGKMAIDSTWHKRFPSDQQTQGILNIMPEIRSWTKADEIESMQYDMTFSDWQEIGSNPKWDPRNRDTADHGLPYVLARNLISGESYLDAFTPDKFPVNDPQVRALMDKLTLGPVKAWSGNGTARLTIRKKTGEVRAFDTHGGVRNATPDNYLRRMTDEDVTAKFKRAATFRGVSAQQQSEALDQWWDLSKIKDISVAMRTLARFGRPEPL
ncbi:MAG: MmgE/PrpD family protein [Vicinamibacterales bacterium]